MCRGARPARPLHEGLLLPANPSLYGEPADRHTLCVSTQVGCAYGCKFCASGLDGWKRNLRVEEIVEQVVAGERGNAARPAATPAHAFIAGPPNPIADRKRNATDQTDNDTTRAV